MVSQKAYLQACDFAGIIELWQLLGQFQQALKMDAVPSLSELAESASTPIEKKSDNDTFNECMVRASFVTSTLASMLFCFFLTFCFAKFLCEIRQKKQSDLICDNLCISSHTRGQCWL